MLPDGTDENKRNVHRKTKKANKKHVFFKLQKKKSFEIHIKNDTVKSKGFDVKFFWEKKNILKLKKKMILKSQEWTKYCDGLGRDYRKI